MVRREVRVNAHLRAIASGAAFVVAFGLSVFAQADASKPAGTPTEMPTKDSPLMFTATNVSMNAGMAGSTQIRIERWTTQAERASLINLLAAAKPYQNGQEPLLEALQKVKPRVGLINLPGRIGWDLRYAVENKASDGTRQIVIVTDKPVSNFAARNQDRILDYPFTLIEMRFKTPGQPGEGKMLTATHMLIKDGQLELENYGIEPTRLTQIVEEKRK
jgi:hypothetical protein